MTARPSKVVAPRPRLRVVTGSRAAIRLHISPWLVTMMVAVIGMFAMVVGRTTLDRGAVELARLDAQIEVADARAAELELQIAGMEGAARIGPLAEQMGMIYPSDRMVLVVDGVVGPVDGADTRWAMQP